MLILTRQEGEEVVITHPETKAELGRVRVQSIRGNKVRVGFEFPICVAVHRAEVFETIKGERVVEALRSEGHITKGLRT